MAALAKLQRNLKSEKLDAFIITNPANIFYLTGFRGVSPMERESILVVKSNSATLITARLYQQEASRLKSPRLEIKIAGERNEINQFIKDAVSKIGSPAEAKVSVGFEEHDLKFSEFREFKKLLKDKKLAPIKHLVEDLRVIKSADEIKNIEHAQIISQRAFDAVIKTIKIGQTEAEIAENLEKIIKSLGGHGLSFDSIVASGPNSAKPHHVTGTRQLAAGDVLLFDFGAKYKNYCADLSRTVSFGLASDKYRNIYKHIDRAQKLAIAKIKTGIHTSQVFKAAHNYFEKNKLNSQFTHSLGHGIGLEVHEKPSLSRKSKDVLREGMVFSVEPGLYFPDWGGVRIEDLVTVKNGRPKILGQPAKFIQIKAKIARLNNLGKVVK